MSEHDTLDFSGYQLLDHTGGSRVRQVPVPRLDSLFHRPRPMRVVLQKFFVVIGLDHQRLNLSQTFDDHFGHVSEVGNKAEAT